MTDITVNADDIRALLGDYSAYHSPEHFRDGHKRLSAALPWEPDEEVVRQYDRWWKSTAVTRDSITDLRNLHDAGLDVVLRRDTEWHLTQGQVRDE